jgi:uncharacterized membrane protein
MESQSKIARSLKCDKGTAGLTILLSVVAMIFVIGFLVMVFAIIGGQLGNEAQTATSISVVAETGAINQTGYTVTNANKDSFRTFVIVNATNRTSGALVGAGNYSYTQAGVIKNATATVWVNASFAYTYVYDANNTASDAIVDTVTSVSGVSSWFPIIITITVMVALILLTVIIIVAISSSGILAQGQ